MNKRADRQRGAIAVEFVFLVIPLLLILAGITEFGRAMYYYNTLAKSTRDAVRLMSTQTPADADYASLKAAAACTAVYGNPSCTGEPLLPRLSTGMVSFCDPASCSDTHASVATGTGAANLVTVTVGGANNPYVFQSMVPLLPGLFGIPDISFGAISVTMRQLI
jgi:Flp pilus assembly protein TadG